MVFNEGSASLTFWSCGCWTFFLSTQPTLSGQDLVPLFYLPRDLILWAVPLPAAANNASPGLHLPVVKSTICYLCPESLHCQEAGGRGAQVPPPPGSRIISPVSPNLTPFAVTPFGWAGKSRQQSRLGSVLCETRWGPQGQSRLWQQMLSHVSCAPGLYQAPCTYLPCDQSSLRPQNMAAPATFLGPGEPVPSSQWPHLIVSILSEACHSVKRVETISFINLSINDRLKWWYFESIGLSQMLKLISPALFFLYFLNVATRKFKIKHVTCSVFYGKHWIRWSPWTRAKV